MKPKALFKHDCAKCQYLGNLFVPLRNTMADVYKRQVLTYRLTGSKDLTVAEFNSDSRDDMAKFNALLDEVRAKAVVNELGIVEFTKPGIADHFYVEHHTEE